MKKFILLSVLFIAFASFAFAEVIQQPKVEGFRTNELIFGGHANVDTVVKSGEEFDQIKNLDAQIFLQFTKDMGSYYAGAKLGLLGMAKGYNEANENPQQLDFGTIAQGVLGISKVLLGKDNFKVKAFAEAAGGILISAGTPISENPATGETEYSTENKLVVSPQLGISVSFDWIALRAFWTTNWVQGVGVGDASVGIAAGVSW